MFIKLTTKDFIERAISIHNNKYDYSKSKYHGTHKKLCIVCPEHGEFWQMPSNHLKGHGCPKCAKNKLSILFSDTFGNFIEKAHEIHNNKYDYSKVQYINNYTEVCIICPKHGEFQQTPHAHLSGNDCPKCAKCYMDKEYFIKKANHVHNYKYNYTKVNYINSKIKVCIICPEHGEFWQNPHNHLNGTGCPKCNITRLERDVMQFLNRHNVEYEYQKRFKWLGRQSLDFYLPDYNIAIECQGIQHYQPVEHFGGEDEFKKIQERDKQKKQLCEEHGIKIKYIK